MKCYPPPFDFHFGPPWKKILDPLMWSLQSLILRANKHLLPSAEIFILDNYECQGRFLKRKFSNFEIIKIIEKGRCWILKSNVLTLPEKETILFFKYSEISISFELKNLKLGRIFFLTILTVSFQAQLNNKGRKRFILTHIISPHQPPINFVNSFRQTLTFLYFFLPNNQIGSYFLW